MNFNMNKHAELLKKGYPLYETLGNVASQKHSCSVGIGHNDHKQARLWVIGRHKMNNFQNLG